MVTDHWSGNPKPTNSSDLNPLLRKVESSQRLLSALRNTVILSSVLGLGCSQSLNVFHKQPPGFLLGLLPANLVQQYVFNVINGLAGVFILVTTVILNKNVVIHLPSNRSSNVSNSSRSTVSLYAN